MKDGVEVPKNRPVENEDISFEFTRHGRRAPLA